MTQPSRIALFADGGDWHASRLAEAFRARGVEAMRLSLRTVAFDTTTRFGLDIPGFAEALPDAAFVRTIDAGSFEQVTLRLGVLHALRDLGVVVRNDARAIERCVDKAATTFHLQRAGLPTPATRVVERLAAARAHVAAAAGPIVAKPLFGSRGRGLRKVETPDDLPTEEAVAGVWYLQAFVAPAPDANGFEDWRVLVSEGRAVASMRRQGRSWITNVHQGGTPHAADDEEIAALAVAAAAAVGIAYGGIDIIRDRHGRPFVLEVNSMPAWNGLQSVTEVDIAQVLADDCLAAAAAAPRA